MRVVPADHLTVGVLYDVERPTLVSEMMSIRWRGRRGSNPTKGVNFVMRALAAKSL